MGVKARSWLGWQLPLRSSDAHAAARIDTIDTGALNAAMAGGEVAVIPGFQGVADTGRVTTLGLGGFDTSGVGAPWGVRAARGASSLVLLAASTTHPPPPP